MSDEEKELQELYVKNVPLVRAIAKEVAEELDARQIELTPEQIVNIAEKICIDDYIWNVINEQIEVFLAEELKKDERIDPA